MAVEPQKNRFEQFEGVTIGAIIEMIADAGTEGGIVAKIRNKVDMESSGQAVQGEREKIASLLSAVFDVVSYNPTSYLEALLENIRSLYGDEDCPEEVLWRRLHELVITLDSLNLDILDVIPEADPELADYIRYMFLKGSIENIREKSNDRFSVGLYEPENHCFSLPSDDVVGELKDQIFHLMLLVDRDKKLQDPEFVGDLADDLRRMFMENGIFGFRSMLADRYPYEEKGDKRMICTECTGVGIEKDLDVSKVGDGVLAKWWSGLRVHSEWIKAHYGESHGFSEEDLLGGGNLMQLLDVTPKTRDSRGKFIWTAPGQDELEENILKAILNGDEEGLKAISRGLGHGREVLFDVGTRNKVPLRNIMATLGEMPLR
jgi:hypothetical protein